MEQKITSCKILSLAKKLKNIAINSEASTELKREIIQIHNNLQNVNQEFDKHFIYTEMLHLSDDLNELKKQIVYCPDTNKPIKVLNRDKEKYLAVKTNALCFSCLRSKYYSCFDNIEPSSWPETYCDETHICKTCNKFKE